MEMVPSIILKPDLLHKDDVVYEEVFSPVTRYTCRSVRLLLALTNAHDLEIQCTPNGRKNCLFEWFIGL